MQDRYEEFGNFTYKNITNGASCKIDHTKILLMAHLQQFSKKEINYLFPMVQDL
jgi:hypothetical protein